MKQANVGRGNLTSDVEDGRRRPGEIASRPSALRQRHVQPLTIRTVALLSFVFGLLVGRGGHDWYQWVWLKAPYFVEECIMLLTLTEILLKTACFC